MASTPENISRFYKPGWFLPFWNRLNGRFPNEDRWVDFDDSSTFWNAGSFFYLDIVPDLEIEGKVKDTQVQIITRIKFSIDNFSLWTLTPQIFNVDKRTEVCDIHAFQSTYLIVFHAI